MASIRQPKIRTERAKNQKGFWPVLNESPQAAYQTSFTRAGYIYGLISMTTLVAKVEVFAHFKDGMQMLHISSRNQPFLHGYV
jgi:hypothetical protein